MLEGIATRLRVGNAATTNRVGNSNGKHEGARVQYTAPAEAAMG